MCFFEFRRGPRLCQKDHFIFLGKKSRCFRREAFLVWSNRSRPKIHNVLFRVLARTSILSKKTFRKKSEKFTNFRREAFVPFGLENDMILIMMHFQNDKKIKKSNIRSSRPFAGCGREGCEHKLTFCVVFYTQGIIVRISLYLANRDQPHLHLEARYRNDI